MIRKCFVVVMVLALPVVATCGREAPLFPDTDPAEVECRIGPRRILMPILIGTVDALSIYEITLWSTFL
jgi:hypothetical protein